MTRDDLFALLDDIYSPGVTPWYESDPALAPRIDRMVQSLRDEVAKIVGTRPALEVPANLNGYHRVSWPMQRGLQPEGLVRPSRKQPSRYLVAQVCAFAPLADVFLLELYASGDRKSVELSDARAIGEEFQNAVLAVAGTMDTLGLQHVPRALLRLPARSEWPRQYWMPEQPEVRNYLFPGFFETWSQ